MQSPEAAIGSAMGFLTSFSGTDTLPVLEAVKYYYNDENVGFSVPASEHSVMCSHGKEGEINTLQYLMKQYPTGILSIVSDTWDLWKLITEYLPQLKEEILSRDGKLVIRPDSGNPVEIICGYQVMTQEEAEEFVYSDDYHYNMNGKCIAKDGKLYPIYVSTYPDGCINEIYADTDENPISLSEQKGVIELLWDIFGGTINEQGYKVLDSHIGAIYDDSITPERAIQIAERLKTKGFANQVVLGIGSYSMGYATIDSQGGAVKSTYVEVKGEARPIFKNPITDDGIKKSAKGLLQVTDELEMIDNCSWEQEQKGLLKIIYKNGIFYNLTNFTKIKTKINSYEINNI
jgi:nicotinamide phosphoribosyltransferase